MKKLIFYSDQVPGKSDELDRELLGLIDRKKPKIAYIPSCSDTTKKYFNQKVEYYKRLGIEDIMYFDIDREYDESMISELLDCDAIHLSGGDTAYVLSNIKKRNFDVLLKKYTADGGVLIGISAGSIIMTGTIDIINVGEKGSSINKSGENDGLGLANFDFMPHWDRGIYDINDYKVYTLKTSCPLYICTDSDGIVVEGENIKLIGNVIKVEKGITEGE